MASSMTGYGSAIADRSSWSVTWEIRSVNSRYLDLKWKIPPSLFFMQGKWQKLVRNHASRGRVEIYLDMRILDPAILGMELDRTTAVAMVKELNNLAGELGQIFTPDLNTFFRTQALWKENNLKIHPDLLQDLENCLNSALEDWLASRKAEGLHLSRDLQQKVLELDSLIGELEGLAAENTRQRFNDLKSRVGRILAEASMESDEQRLLQELALMADRLDVSEELTRLRVHLNSISILLETSGETGRRLDFLLQEAFREINTCANKCQNPDMSRLAVDFKVRLEKCREQIQNLE